MYSFKLTETIAIIKKLEICAKDSNIFYYEPVENKIKIIITIIIEYLYIEFSVIYNGLLYDIR